MSEYRARMEEVIGGIASLITAEMTATLPILLGDSGVGIDHVGYADGDPEIWLRTTSGEVWILRTTRLGNNMQYGGRDDERKLVNSYKQYLALVNESKRFVKGAEACDVPGDLALQTWVDEVLNDAERECWYRWSPGGYATAQETEVLGRYRNDI